MTDTPAQALPSASLLKRLLAFSYDLFILLALSMGYSGLATLLMVSLGIKDSGDYQPMHESYWFSLGWLFSIIGFYWFFWKRVGQTIGMRTWRLKVVDQKQNIISHRQCLIRILLGPISLGLFGLGYLWCLVNKNKAAWHDIASNTRVIQMPKPSKN